VQADLRVALVGYGLAGSVFHAPLIAATPGLRLATIVTADPERSERAAREHPDAAVAASADAIWNRAAEHDLVVVATANAVHVELAERALDAGLAVVVDKPLAATAAEARALVERADAAGMMLTVFHNRRWDSDQLTLRRLLAEGRLGDVYRYESRFERWRPEAKPGAWREETPPELGGGVLLDIGTHLVDQALTLFGPVVAVHGEVDARRGGVADDDAFIALEHESGVHSHLWASVVAAAPGPRLRVLGSEGAYLSPVLDGQEDALRRGDRPGSGVAWGLEPESSWGHLVRDGESSEPIPSDRGDWPRFYSELEAALRSGGAPPVDPADAVTGLEILERARRPR
jgi:scyllo-inositol 2-dehydrogenase (NADP+)